MSSVLTCSIDDGHPSDLRLAALLARHGWQATFYCPIKNREGMPVMAPALMRELAQGFEIGSHTYSHQFLTEVSNDRAALEIERGKSVLEHILGQPVAGFCYPGGKFRKAHVRQVQAAGFSYARTTVNLSVDGGDDRYEMATTCQFYPHGRGVYLRNYARAGAWRRRAPGLLRTLHQSDWLGRLYSLLELALERDGVFHLWAHTADIERRQAWAAFDSFLRYAASCVVAADRLNNFELAERQFGVTPGVRPISHPPPYSR